MAACNLIQVSPHSFKRASLFTSAQVSRFIVSMHYIYTFCEHDMGNHRISADILKRERVRGTLSDGVAHHLERGDNRLSNDSLDGIFIIVKEGKGSRR